MPKENIAHQSTISNFQGQTSEKGMVSGLTYSLTIVACSDNGWITSKILVHWADIFLKEIPDDNLPRVLLLDGHSTHTYNLRFLEMMKARNFHVFCFPSHTTHWLQAADKSFFRSFKSNWNNIGRNHVRTSSGGHLPKAHVLCVGCKCNFAIFLACFFYIFICIFMEIVWNV